MIEALLRITGIYCYKIVPHESLPPDFIPSDTTLQYYQFLALKKYGKSNAVQEAGLGLKKPRTFWFCSLAATRCHARKPEPASSWTAGHVKRKTLEDKDHFGEGEAKPAPVCSSHHDGKSILDAPDPAVTPAACKHRSRTG